MSHDVSLMRPAALKVEVVTMQTHAGSCAAFKTQNPTWSGQQGLPSGAPLRIRGVSCGRKHATRAVSLLNPADSAAAATQSGGVAEAASAASHSPPSL